MLHIKKTIPAALLALVLLAGSAMASTQAASKVAVDLNKASIEQLSELPFVGPKRAELIVMRRQQKPFRSVDELTEIKGIGEKTLEKIRPHVAVSSARKP